MPGYLSEELLQETPQGIYDEGCHDDFSRRIQELRKEGAGRCRLIHSGRNGTRVPVDIVDIYVHSFSNNVRQVVLSI